MATTTKTLLFSWIGDADLLAWSSEIDSANAEQVQALLGKQVRPGTGAGPIKTLTGQLKFDDIHLLSDKSPELVKQFAQWIAPNSQVHPVQLSSPVDYVGIFEATDAVLGRVTASASVPCSIAIHLSPGTPAMTAVWVLLGKSKYPATFYQTYRGKVLPTTIPFDLLVDYIPRVLHDSDRLLQDDRTERPTQDGFGSIIGRSNSIRATIGRAKRIAIRDVGVIILGESGVGKDVFARAIHAASSRRKHPFVAINCAAIPRELLESELFGHSKGAFTGAHSERSGAFEEADNGTLFLDEVGECEPSMQAKLLRVLQPTTDETTTTRTFRRVGDSRERRSNVRVIAATNRDLQADVAAGRFREDLYYRLAVMTLQIPSLRSRPADVQLIAEHILERVNNDFAKTEPGYVRKRLSALSKQFLSEQSWPGNVRQLQNVLVQSAVMTEGAMINPRDIAPAISAASGPPPNSILTAQIGDGFSLTTHLEKIQRHFLSEAMQQTGGRKSAAAKLLGYSSYQTLAAQLERLKVDWR